MQTTDAQNIAFWPPLYLPASGMLWSSPSTISRARPSHSRSASVITFRCRKRKKMETKDTAISTPRKG